MADIENIKVGSTSYSIKDATAAHDLSDIAVAGDNVTFTTPSNIDYIPSSAYTGSERVSSLGLYTPNSSSYITINNSVITNYTSSIYTRSYDWAWTFKFKTPEDITKQCRIFVIGNGRTNFNVWCSLSEGSNTSGTVAAGVHVSGTGDWLDLYAGDSSATVLQADSWYYIRLSRDITNSVYKLELSTDGSTWTTEATASSSNALYNSSTTCYISNVDSSYTALQYDLTGCKFTTSYSSVNDWVAYITDDRTTVSAAGLPSQSGNSGKFLTTNGTTASWGNALKNETTSTGALSIRGNSSAGTYAVAIGYDARSYGNYGICIAPSYGRTNYSGQNNAEDGIAIGSAKITSGSTKGIAIGYGAVVNQAAGGMALGYGANVTAANSIQLGYGTNSTANSLSIGLSSSNNYTLLESDGTIPDARLKSDVLINTATGTKCLTIGGTASASDRSTNVGIDSIASGSYSSAFGRNAVTVGNFSVAVGAGSRTNSGAKNSIAIGCDAQIAANVENAILLGKLATSSESNTFKVAFASGNTTAVDESTGLFTMLDSTGKIPAARLTNAIQGAITSTTVTLTSAGWSSNTQTVNVTGMTATSIVWVSPAGASMSDYASAGVYCSAQASGTLTFTCTTAPSSDLTVQVVFG